MASTDWRHLGRLAGFTNQKPQRRNWRGYPPWVKVLHARAGVAAQGAAWLEAAERHLDGHAQPARPPGIPLPAPRSDAADTTRLAHSVAVAEAANLYAGWLHRLRILERFPQPDWSIVDKWIAKELLRRGAPAPQVAALLRGGSPGFPRQHAHPEDYLRRTLARAALELHSLPFPRRDPLVHRSGHNDAPGS